MRNSNTLFLALILGLFILTNARFRQNSLTPEPSIDAALSDGTGEAEAEEGGESSGKVIGGIVFKRCTAADRNPEHPIACAVNPEFQIDNGCTCYFDGHCEDSFTNLCTCQQPNVANYTTGALCDGTAIGGETTEEGSEANVRFFIPKICSSTEDVLCTEDTVPGCVCYSNKTCEYRTDGNDCKWCKMEGVDTFNANEECPFTESFYACTESNRKAAIEGEASMEEASENLVPPCSYIVPGCVCYDDGHCEEKDTNLCACADQKVVAVHEDAGCPTINNPF
jgi:hypothetical protein